MFKYDVLCIGSATLDNFLTIEQKFNSIRPGDKVLVKNIEKHSGGGGTNSAAALSKLGLKVKLLTKLGNDHDAEFIHQEMKKFKVKNICLHHSHHHTDFSTLVYSTPDKNRVIYVHKGASQDLAVTDFKKSQLKAEWVYLATLVGKSLQTAKEIVKSAENKSLKLLFNPSLYLAKLGKSSLAPILKNTTILVLNKDEAQALLKTTSNSFNLLLFGLQKLGPPVVVITNGPKRVYALHENIIYSVLPPEVKVVHTAGAGDAFTSGLLAGTIKKYPFADALKLGMVNSLSVIQHIGTKHKLLNMPEANQAIQKYHPQVISHACKDNNR